MSSSTAPTFRALVEARMASMASSAPSLPLPPSLREQVEAQLVEPLSSLSSSASTSTDSLKEALAVHMKSSQWPMRAEAPSFHPSTNVGGCFYFGETSDYGSSDESTNQDYSSEDEESGDGAPCYVVGGCTFYPVENDFAFDDADEEEDEIEEEEEDESSETIYGKLQSELWEEEGQRPTHSEIVARFVESRMSYYKSAD